MYHLRILLALVVLVSLPSLSGYGDDVRWADIIEAWAARDARMQSVHVQWKESRVEVRSQDKSDPFGGDSNKNLKKFTHEGKMEFAFDGQKTRQRRTYPIWHAGHAQYYPNDSFNVYDGQNGVRLTEYGTGDKFRFQAYLTETVADRFYRMPGFRTALNHFRPVRTVMAEGVYSLAERQPRAVNGVPRVTFVQQRKGQQNRFANYITVIPSQDYSIASRKRYVGDKLASEEKTTHKKVGDDWVPSRWKHVHYQGDRKRLTIDAVVTKCELNKPHPASRYQLQFPVGTFLTNQVNGKNDQYVVRKDKSLREVSSAELQKLALEELVEPEPSESPE